MFLCRLNGIKYTLELETGRVSSSKKIKTLPEDVQRLACRVLRVYGK